MKIGIIGAGSWGTALANLLAGNGHDVCIWDVDPGLLKEIEQTRENKKYLPGRKVPESVVIVDTQENCVKDADIVVTAVPSQHFRSALSLALPYISEDAIIVNVSKGIELGSLMTLSEIALEIAPSRRYIILSPRAAVFRSCVTITTLWPFA